MYASFVRFSHSVFALPFALAGALLALAHRAARPGARLGWIVGLHGGGAQRGDGVQPAGGRRYDARNPRTAMRELPRGAMSRAEAVGVRRPSRRSLFMAAASRLAEPVLRAVAGGAGDRLLVLARQARTRRYTQLFLGLAMAVAPVGGWLAAGGRGGWEPWLLGLAIGAWVGGFDVLYACQDLEFDRARGAAIRFRSASACRASLLLSRVMHVVTVAALAALGGVAGLGRIYFAGVAVVAALLVYEQSLVSADDLSQVKRAFDMNG